MSLHSYRPECSDGRALVWAVLMAGIAAAVLFCGCVAAPAGPRWPVSGDELVDPVTEEVPYVVAP